MVLGKKQLITIHPYMQGNLTRLPIYINQSHLFRELSEFRPEKPDGFGIHLEFFNNSSKKPDKLKRGADGSKKVPSAPLI